MPVGPAMVRALLAVLALQPHRTVPRAEIIDALWDDNPPASHANLIQVYASRLRAQLRDTLPRSAGDDDLVRCEAGGYRLGLDPAAVDRTRFERLLRRAREADAAGDRQRAIDAYDAALCCWRGGMLEDLGPKFAQHPLVVETEQRRVDAAIAHARLCAEQGRHELALDRLRAVAPLARFHEGLQAQLILALTGVGDRGAAFEAYRQVSRQLREEIGVDPGSQLQAAYLQLLHDGSGDRGPVEAADAPDPSRRGAPPGPGSPDDPPPARVPPGDAPPIGATCPPAASRLSSPPRRPRRAGRQAPRVLAAVVAVGAIATCAAWGAGRLRGSPAPPTTSATSAPFVWGPEGAFTSLVHWNWGYGPSLGSTPTGRQWAEAWVTGLVDTYSCAAFRFRVITTPDPEVDKHSQHVPDAHGILVSVCRDHWQIEAGHKGDFYRENAEMPPSGALRIEISPDDVVHVTYAGRAFAGHRLRASGYPGRQIFPAGYQGGEVNVHMTGIRSNASR